MRRLTWLLPALLSGMVAFGAQRASAQSLLGTWTITNTAQNACPGQLEITSGDDRSGHYTGFASFQCGGDPAVTEVFDIVVAHGKVAMHGRDASGPWCADEYSLDRQGESAMTGSSKDWCGAAGTVSLARTR
ncbi:MAG TPA: hypothetical protein VMB34_15430 [Acetobacteraceae bacterium]|nr:hypothetical protein [Acetobacteraceae bacterium]